MLDPYEQHRAATLALVRAEKPTTFVGLKLILDRFETALFQDGAYFPRNGEDSLDAALMDAGWSVDEETTTTYTAVHPTSGAVVIEVEGDLYCLLEGQISPLPVLTAPRSH